jgi:undecaprenyl-diphosphatase
MPIIDAIILGLVQGITKFIPISSSGHLVITSHLLGTGSAFTFDVLLNFGTLLALIIYYRNRIWSITKRTLKGKEWLLLAKIIVATIPAVIIGILFKDQIEKLNEMIWVVIVMLIVIGIPMILAGKANKNADDREIEKSVGWRATAKIGIAQALALIPGTSRSGITILAGLRSNLSAAKAAEFSFLLAIPVIAGASLKTLVADGGIDFVKDNLAAVVIGNIASFTAGILAVSFLIKFLSNRGLKDFGWYRIALATILIILLAAGII